MEELAGYLAEAQPGLTKAAARERASELWSELWSELVGAVVLARATVRGRPELSEEILTAVRKRAQRTGI